MNKKPLTWITLALFALLIAAPASASGLHIYGSWWDVGDLDEAAGGGVKLAIPITDTVNIDLRGTYYEQIKDENFFDDLFEEDESVFRDNAVDITPIEAGISFNLASDAPVNFVLGAGASYFLLDSDRGEIDDEVGWYGSAGLELASQGSVGFFAEAVYRSAEGTVESDPGDFEDIDDIEDVDFDDVAIDLDGIGINAGIVWRW